MMLPYFVGALTMLIGIVVGHVLAKPWFDKQFNQQLQVKKVVQKPEEIA